MAAENAVLREELRRMPEELQRSSRLDQKRLEGQISRLQSEVRTLLADVVAAKEGLKQSELRIEAECAAAATVAHDEAFEAAREEKEKALRLAATHAATALEDALSRAKAERDAALAAAATRSERALAEERQRSQREIADAIARAKVEAAEAMAAEKGELHARLERVAQEAEAIRDELGRSKRAMEDTVQAERAKAQHELQAAAERAAADLAAAAEKAQREQAVALKAMEESYLANPIIKEVEVIKQVVKVKEVIKEVPKPVYVEVEKVVYREKGKPKTALPWEQPRPRTAPSGLPRTAPSGVADSVTIPAAEAIALDAAERLTSLKLAGPSADCNQLMGPSALMPKTAPKEPEGRAQDGGGAQDGVFVTQACADSINFEGGATAALGIGAPFLAALETFYMQHGVAGAWARPDEPFMLTKPATPRGVSPPRHAQATSGLGASSGGVEGAAIMGAGTALNGSTQRSAEGPMALSRAQCVLEAAAVLASGGRVHVELATHEWSDLPALLETSLGQLDQSIRSASVDGLQLPSSASAGAMRARFEALEGGAPGALAADEP
ncbi:hypothetical protein Ctob_004374 [Chrysochromulina tobinii]|uniref:Uncharacterized protein n=2 Tax=Chrysochromulina tobinii TaxID=1460289 RepID=A0A0M0JJ95_9EUKA|nr:hypothetical protein Ctob_004374 [Chrysochromulina tobinii]|eukprot:KOO26649.1 hypothetical protein Ctob_004374 [Chrysochromulina sp. CCMP291]